MQRALFYDQSPSFWVPLRFFISAPVFVLIAAGLLFWYGPEALHSRWSPYTLALTHLLTLGVLAMAMTGALIQILAVAANISIDRPRLTATVVHLFLSTGTLLLTGAFWLAQPLLFKLAIITLAFAFSWLLAACAAGLWHAPKSGADATINGVRMALAALALAVTIGVVLASAFGWSLSMPLMLLTDLHVGWGLAGWTGLLIVAVAFQVIPMFQVTELYPAHVTRWLPRALFLLLIVWSTTLIAGLGGVWLNIIAAALILTAYGTFALVTLHLLWHRKRPYAEATTHFWRIAMISLLACGPLWIAQLFNPDIDLSLTLGVLFIIGFAYSAINGMLYKIVPFLVWYHLQHTPAAERRAVPKVKNVIPARAQKQFWAHLAALLLLVAATLWPPIFTRAAALALGLSSCWLWINLLIAAHLYRRVKRQTALPTMIV